MPRKKRKSHQRSQQLIGAVFVLTMIVLGYMMLTQPTITHSVPSPPHESATLQTFTQPCPQNVTSFLPRTLPNAPSPSPSPSLSNNVIQPLERADNDTQSVTLEKADHDKQSVTFFNNTMQVKKKHAKSILYVKMTKTGSTTARYAIQRMAEQNWRGLVPGPVQRCRFEYTERGLREPRPFRLHEFCLDHVAMMELLYESKQNPTPFQGPRWKDTLSVIHIREPMDRAISIQIYFSFKETENHQDKPFRLLDTTDAKKFLELTYKRIAFFLTREMDYSMQIWRHFTIMQLSGCTSAEDGQGIVNGDQNVINRCVAKAKQVLDGIDIVAVTEDLDQAFAEIAWHQDWPLTEKSIMCQKKNFVASRPTVEYFQKEAPNEFAKLRRLMDADNQIYLYAKQLAQARQNIHPGIGDAYVNFKQAKLQFCKNGTGEGGHHSRSTNVGGMTLNFDS